VSDVCNSIYTTGRIASESTLIRYCRILLRPLQTTSHKHLTTQLISFQSNKYTTFSSSDFLPLHIFQHTLYHPHRGRREFIIFNTPNCFSLTFTLDDPPPEDGTRCAEIYERARNHWKKV
jgi:hypothetical protein